MSAKLMEELSVALPADDFHALEEKIYRTIELLKQARQAKDLAERTAARLREQLDSRDEQTQSLRAEVVTLRRERQEIRTRVEKMLKQIDSLTQEESGA